jgi:ATP-binding cassette subfamily C (CFTR/MRP) protein 1
MLGVMKAVKLQGLGDVLYNRITRLRMEELKTSELFRRLIVGEISICMSSNTADLCVTADSRAANIPVDFAPFATFTIYAISSGRSLAGQLSIEQAFTSLAIITLLTAPLLNFCQAFPSLVEAIACLGRVEDYCSSTLYLADNTGLDMGAPASSVMELSVLKHGCQGTTQSAGPTSPNPSIILSSQILSIEKGITAIIEPTGSGKSTLLREILRGQAHAYNFESGGPLRVAYCKQDP